MSTWSELAAIGVQSGALRASNAAGSTRENGIPKIGRASRWKSGLLNRDGIQHILVRSRLLDILQATSQITRREPSLLSRHWLLRLRSIRSERLRVVVLALMGKSGIAIVVILPTRNIRG